MNQENNSKDQPRHHVFDGIQEYDNDLPRWWVNLFIITIIFGAGYLIWYQTPWGKGPSQDEEFKAAWAENKESSKQHESGEIVDFATAMKNPEILAKGKETYSQFCIPCHGANAQGDVGPNLTDDFWIYGSTFQNLEDVISKGRAEKGMPAWGEILGHEKVVQVIAYIGTLQGSKPEKAKAAQGNPGKLQ